VSQQAPVAPEAAAPAPAAAVSTAQTAPVTAPAASPALPVVASYTLPVDNLQQVAQNSGLVWVNSDSAKVAAVQAAIAAEPPVVRVPRERPPAVVVNEGPLVLVETRKDLNTLQVPF
jgi:ribonuclease E